MNVRDVIELHAILGGYSEILDGRRREAQDAFDALPDGDDRQAEAWLLVEDTRMDHGRVRAWMGRLLDLPVATSDVGATLERITEPHALAVVDYGGGS